jgi:cytochrome P450 family 13
MIITRIDNRICSRRCGADTKLGPLSIEKGTDVVLDVLSLHFDRKIFGDDAEEFRPERWLETNTPQNALLSFGGGPRICAGMRLAYLEQKLLLTYLLREYRFLPSNEMVRLLCNRVLSCICFRS